MSTTAPELEIRNLACIRGDRLLFRSLNLGASSGELVQVTGPNGCGKTSLLRIVCGLALAEEGEVLWHAENTRSSEHFKQQCAYVGHRDGLKADLSARENLTFHARLTGGAAFAVDAATGRLGLADCRDLPASQLSAGQRRRMALARLLLGEQRLWILDEPFTALDDAGRALIEALLNEHRDRGGLALFTSHQALRHAGLRSACRELPLAAPDLPRGAGA